MRSLTNSSEDSTRFDSRRCACRRRRACIFEEWDDATHLRHPLGRRAGRDCRRRHRSFPTCARRHSPRIGSSRPTRCEAAAPDLIVASWCGKKVRKAAIASRPGWSDIPAVTDGHVYEIKSTYILQPGPASLTEGVRQLHYLICRVAGDPPTSTALPEERVDPTRACRVSVRDAVELPTMQSRGCRRRQPRWRISSRNSCRVRASPWNTPSIALVVVTEFCFSTPRIAMQRCVASMTTATPSGRTLSANGLGDLRRQPFLHLQPPREHVDEPRNLAEADDLAVGNVGDVALAEERQQVMLAEAVEVDVPHDNHLVILDGERVRR